MGRRTRRAFQYFWHYVTRTRAWLVYHRTLSFVHHPDISPDGPGLYCSNHPGFGWDPSNVATFGPHTPRSYGDWFFWTDSGIMVGLQKYYLRGIGCVSVYKDSATTRALAVEDLFRETLAALEENGRIVLFPEGFGGAYPPLQPLKTGAARVALAYYQQTGRDVPLIPVAQDLREGISMVITVSEGAELNVCNDFLVFVFCRTNHSLRSMERRCTSTIRLKTRYWQ